MLRKSRIDAPGALHYIICRGLERRPIFEDDFDRDRFVERLGTILQETATPCYAYDFKDFLSRVCELFGLTRREVSSWSKQRNRAIARSLLACWSVRELGVSASAVAERLGLSPSAESRCVQRGGRIVADNELVLQNSQNA